ncbi:hypothetical protein HPB48_020204 [Haemaphysalis longicornis]|uniref:Sulfatase N-terminal domain-containing protein n=1 Tax=Haemaphysalis longicornis TaxID=44386 RepID=A0A9J6FCQ8_HAELO|nr:hypothetical protein HPB48_020204 [Haemaphysalis longicornis]
MKMKGWGDVSFHGSPQIPTPNLDSLAADGIVLNSLYGGPSCAPSRAALMTGLYPVRYGAPRYFPSSSTLRRCWLDGNAEALPSVFKSAACLCTWGELADKGHCGYDFWFNQEVLESASGVYSMDIFLSRATTVIRDHDISQETFADSCVSFGHLGLLDTLDQATGVVLEALYEKGMLENCLIVFSSDNGADIAGGGSNWPLRGVKQTLWEGGVRLPAFVWSPLLGARGRVSWDPMHFVDWLPTLYHMAGGNTDDLGPIDGVSQWETLSTGAPSKRQELLLGFNVLNSAGAYRSGRYKLVVSPSDGSWDEFREEPPGNVSLAIDLDQLMADSAVAQTLAKFYNTGTPSRCEARVEAVRFHLLRLGAGEQLQDRGLPLTYSTSSATLAKRRTLQASGAT